MPQPIPIVGKAALVADDRVLHTARNRHGEFVAGNATAIQVQHQIDAVGARLRVARGAVTGARFAFRLLHAQTEEQAALVAVHPYLGGEGRRLARQRADGHQLAHALRASPLWLVEAAVEFDGVQRQGKKCE